jgi:bacteriorhodopsin
MVRKTLTRAGMVPVILCLQLVPLLLFPPAAFGTDTQEWWLPVLLAMFALVAVAQLLVRRSPALWPWYLISFAQGFNIISRLMMLMPHAMVIVDGQERFNTLYVLLSVVSMIWSTAIIVYAELPEVRGYVHRKTPSRPAPSQA